jgi:hypothetical protein
VGVAIVHPVVIKWLVCFVWGTFSLSYTHAPEPRSGVCFSCVAVYLRFAVLDAHK